MKFSEKWLSKKVMCGYCNFACCNHNTFKVWTTPEERELYKNKYNLEVEDVWEQKGHCKLLNDDGCCLGDDRPINCKMFPVVENKTGRLILSNWAALHCPKPSDYELVEFGSDGYRYVLKEPHKNKKDELFLEDDIDVVIDELWKQQEPDIEQKYGVKMSECFSNPLEKLIDE